MNVTFSRSLSGFNREEVINYISKLTSEKSRAEKDACTIAEKLEGQESYIDELKATIAECDDNIAKLNAELNEKDELIADLNEQVSRLTEQLSSAKDEMRQTLDAALLKAGAAETGLRTMAAQLTELSERVKKAHFDISDAVVTIEDYTRE